MTLTRKQTAVLSYLQQYSRAFGRMPSTREIQAHFGHNSQTAAVGFLKRMEAKGAIKRQMFEARAIEIL